MVCIRKATLADVPEIRDCYLACSPGEDPDACFSYFNDCIISPFQVVYAAEYNGRIVGYVVAKIFEEEYEEEEDCQEEGEEDEDIQGYVEYLGVHPTCRKLGIATKLMDAAQNAMVQQGYKYVYLYVRPSNHAAINLCTKVLGYKFLYTLEEYYYDGEDAYVMRKQLLGKQTDHLVLGFSHGGGCFWTESNAELLGVLDTLENILDTITTYLTVN